MTSTQCMYTYNTLSLTQSQYTSYAPQYATHKPERAVTPEQLTQAHIHTQTLSVEASSNSSLRHIYTHKPKRGGLQQQLTQAHIYTQTQAWRTPATAHSGTQTLSVELPQQQLTQAHIHTQTLSVGQLQQQLTQAHIYTQTKAWNDPSNS